MRRWCQLGDGAGFSEEATLERGPELGEGDSQEHLWEPAIHAEGGA